MRFVPVCPYCGRVRCICPPRVAGRPWCAAGQAGSEAGNRVIAVWWRRWYARPGSLPQYVAAVPVSVALWWQLGRRSRAAWVARLPWRREPARLDRSRWWWLSLRVERAVVGGLAVAVWPVLWVWWRLRDGREVVQPAAVRPPRVVDVPLPTISAIAKAVGKDFDPNRFEPHWQRVEQLERDLAALQQRSAEQAVYAAEQTARATAAEDGLAAVRELHTEHAQGPAKGECSECGDDSPCATNPTKET